MKLVEKYPILGSSQDPDKISLTVQGAALTIIPVVVMIVGGFGVTLNPELLGQFVTTLAGIATSVATLIGVGRKILNQFKK